MTSEEFKALRRDMDLTQEELAEKLSKSIRMVRYWENGKFIIPPLVAHYMQYITKYTSCDSD